MDTTEIAGRIGAAARPSGMLGDLIRAGRDGEAAVQARLAAALRDLGATIETLRYRPADIAMVGEFADVGARAREPREAITARVVGKGGGRSLVLFAHPDSEPAVDVGGWVGDPFEPRLADGRIHGWGVADDLAGVAAAVEALAALKAAGLAPAGDVIVASTPSKRHARGIAALLQRGLKADAALYLHPAESGAGMGEIKAATCGQLEFRIEIDGMPLATSEPHQTAFAHQAVDPVARAWSVWAALKAWDEARAKRVRHAALDAAVGRATNVMISHVAAGDPGLLSRAPSTAVLAGAIAFPPGERLADVQAEVAAVVQGSELTGGEFARRHPPRLTWIAGTTGAEVLPGHFFYQAVAAAVRAGTAAEPIYNPMHTASDIRNPILLASMPTVGLGPLCGDLSQNGRSNEWVDAADYDRSVRVIALAIALWCGVAAA